MPDTNAEAKAADKLAQKKLVLLKIREFRREGDGELTEKHYKEISEDGELKSGASYYFQDHKKIQVLDLENEAVKFEVDTLAFVNQIGFEKKLSEGTKLKNVSGVSGPATFTFQTKKNTHQVDCIAVYQNTIFVIECKYTTKKDRKYGGLATEIIKHKFHHVWN